ncbi:PASTA domain-containing protein [Micromonospora kangleipakensis]|nr:PASTA domain-containing protein [Micromonospora kangleipakensis]
MTNGYPERQGSPGPADQGPDRVRLLLGGGLAVVLLAVIGASGGWILAGGDSGPADRPVAAATTAPAPTGATPTTEAPRSTPPVTRTTTAAGGLTVPVLVGVDFEDARRQLHERKLGWRLVFGAGAGRNVERTSPEPGTPVRRGVTVTLWVAGPAPAVAVPDLVGDDCDDAADDLVEAGLYPRYRTGRRGTVTVQDPAAGAAARWNDPVALVCGAPPSTPPASPAPTP